MDSLSKDVLFNIATMLDLDNLLNFCSSSDRINKLICQGEAIWLFKLEKEFPDYKDKIDKRGREAYQLLTRLDKLKKDFKYTGSIYQLYNTTSLDLTKKGFISIPPEIGNLINLQKLYLNGNQITSIPPEIGNLINLKTLYLNGNQITSIPPEIGNLINLEELMLDRNQITSIPPEIGNLKQLKYLFINYNKIKKLPIELGKLKNLNELVIDTLVIPPELKHLPIAYF